MATSTSYRPLRVDHFDRDRWDQEAAEVDGLAMGAVAFTQEQFEDTPDDHPGVMAWEHDVVDAAIKEIGPQVADLLYEALNKRLPWTWEPER